MGHSVAPSNTNTYAPTDSHDKADSHNDSHNDSHDTSNTYNIQNGASDQMVGQLTNLIARQSESMTNMMSMLGNSFTNMMSSMSQGMMNMMGSRASSLWG